MRQTSAAGVSIGQSLVGYARVSTADQTADLQTDALGQAGCHRVFLDVESGAVSDRPQLLAALDYLREGDTLVVWRLDRLGRSLKHLIETVSGLEQRGIGFRSLRESIDTTTPSGRLIFHVFGALAEFERDLIRERTRAGLEAARARGSRPGRKRSLTPQQAKRAAKLSRQDNHTVADVARLMGVSRATIYRVLAEDPSTRTVTISTADPTPG